MSKIIVAGAGHGGLAVAAQLAQSGFSVTVYEKCAEGELGYDWTDIFAGKALTIAGIPFPDESKFEYKENMTFFSADLKTAMKQDVPESQLEIKMERRDIYELLISHAINCGVKIVYGCTVNAPIVTGNRVVGISSDMGDFYADLVIDAAGLNSPLRNGLPAKCGINPTVMPFERFYVYRAFYDRLPGYEVEDKYKVYLFPGGRLGVGWVATEGEHTDVLIGRFTPFGKQEVDATLTELKKHNPQLGDTLLRGGQYVQIPVRQALSVLVCDGYAAIGDSAFMTVPVIGSGIANSLKASKMLYDTICADITESYSTETLWGYQIKYFSELGSGFAPLACVKLLLTKLSPKELDYIFAHGIITAKELTIGADTVSLAAMISFDIPDLLNRAKHLCKDKALLVKILRLGTVLGKIIAITAAMPKTGNPRLIAQWAKRYDAVFNKYSEL